MKTKYVFQITSVIILASLTVFCGCAGTSQPSKFYLLSALAQSETTSQMSTDNSGILIGIGPITLPSYLNRSKIVTRISENEIDLAEFHLWAEPLKDNIARVLMENLSSQLKTDQIYIYPWRPSTKVDYQVIIEVVRFDVGFDGNALLIVYRTTYGKDGKEILPKKKSVFREQIGSKAYKAVVAAQNHVLMEFSHEIASTIKGIHP